MLVDELAQGLGFWAARYQPLPDNPALGGPLDAAHATARLAAPARPRRAVRRPGRQRAAAGCRPGWRPGRRIRGTGPGIDDGGPLPRRADQRRGPHARRGSDAPRDPGEAAAADADPEPLLERLDPLAVEHGDEHVVKLTEAAGREYRRTGDTTLLVAADRFRERVRPLGTD